ncbi:DEAD/DEAH box helicase family protein [Ottowia sp.]|uniref:DEAD/DEAH box helicase family protein n=1 Tax=Ottowia sp. TaxID=1898956 RepID=UPI0025F3F9F8|nr:DEAD/DEAH box helicase family protein [Ottowia sp.]
MTANGIRAVVQDTRFQGAQIDVRFAGTLRDDQEVAAEATLQYDTGVLCAPTAFGKTVTAAAVIARRGVNTLVLVHRTELLTQWQERLLSFLAADKNVIGRIGGGKSKPTGKIDIAVMQSLARNEELSALLDNYGQVIVDECHHIGAVSFDLLLRRAKAKYVLGLTATPCVAMASTPSSSCSAGRSGTRPRGRTARHNGWRSIRFAWQGLLRFQVTREFRTSSPAS